MLVISYFCILENTETAFYFHNCSHYHWRSSSSIRKWQMCVVVMYMVNMFWLTANRFLDPSVSNQMTGSRGFWWLSSLSIPFLLASREVRYPSLLPSSLCCPSLYTEPHSKTTPTTSIWSLYSITYFSECGMQQSLGFISHSAHIIAPCPLQCNRMASNQYSFEYHGHAMQLFCLFVPLWIFGHDVLYTAIAWQDWSLPYNLCIKLVVSSGCYTTLTKPIKAESSLQMTLSFAKFVLWIITFTLEHLPLYKI